MRIRVLVVLLLFVATCFAEDAATLFRKQCALCHGPDGHASGPMSRSVGAADLTSAPVKKASDAELKTALARGKGKMPPYGPGLGPKGVDEMVKYVRALK